MAILSFGVLQCLRKVVVTMMRIGYEHVDRLITYPYLHNLSANAQPIRMSERHRERSPMCQPSAGRVDCRLRRLQVEAGAVLVVLDGVDHPAVGDQLDLHRVQFRERG